MEKNKISGLVSYFKGGSLLSNRVIIRKEQENEIVKEKISRAKFNKIIEDLKNAIPGIAARVYKEDQLIVDFLIVRRVLERHFEIVEEK